MSADILLQHLSKIKRTRPGSWLACCPAHTDKTASLSVRELDDSRVLVHCFAGCSVQEIMSAVCLDISDLFPPREEGKHFSKGERRPFPAADVLRAVAHESLIIYLAAQFVAKGEKLPEADTQRLLIATSRIQAALTAGGVTNG
jgi:hypothetical protein